MGPAALLLAIGCGSKPPEATPTETTEAPRRAAEAAAADAPDTCPATEPAPVLLPGVRPEHKTLDYWLARLGKDQDLDRELMSPDEVRRLNRALRVPRAGFYPQRDLMIPVDEAEVARQVSERFDWLRERFEDGRYVDAKGGKIAPTDFGPIPESAIRPEVRVALAPMQIYCDARTDGYFGASLDLRIDHNACSTAHEQEPVLVLASWPAGMKLVRTRYTVGWVPDDAPLSPPVTDRQKEQLIRGPFATVTGGPLEIAGDTGTVTLPEGTRVVLAADDSAKRKRRRKSKAPDASKILVATAESVAAVPVDSARVRPVARPFTRRAVLTEAFRHLGSRYGYGGKDAGIDCSRMLLDIFESFGIEMPRHSSWQGKAGSFSIPLDGVSVKERLLLLDAASEKGIVILPLPGHIMLYLGRNDEGEPMALHAFAEYQKSCDQPDPVNSETKMLVDEVQVSNLDLGRGTSKTSFIERIDRITVFGAAPGDELAGAAIMRPAAPVEVPERRRDCRSRRGIRLWAAPLYANKDEPLKIVAFGNRDPGPVEIAMVDPKGEVHRPELARLGGPPYGWVAQIDRPRPGRWRVAFGDGDDVRACRGVYVRSKLPASVRKQLDEKYKSIPKVDRIMPGDEVAPIVDPLGNTINPATVQTGVPIWPVGRNWRSSDEDLFALFVERLFDYPIDDDRTWHGLHEVLQDKDRNILYNYLGLDEDSKLKMFPDCAELSYALRAYFSWKLRLPFAYTTCKRARPGKPPECQPAGDNLIVNRANVGREDEDEVGAFQQFSNLEVSGSVNSSSGRTHPDDEAGDYYPIRLTKRSLPPGTLYNDPYGHVMVVADWVPQGAGKYGMLIAADAQPDGTIGRRRFWRGSFLWKPDTDSGGAGFKAYRPAIYDKKEGVIERLENEKLSWRRSRWTRYSDRVYKGSQDDFYRTMESLINPRPLDPVEMMVALVDALEEQVVRRVVSVDNGEKYMKESGEVMEMPKGRGIFLASTAWEEYSTPSRDLRLLIAIDTVANFPKEVKATPARFNVDEADAGKVVAELEKKLRATLESRSFEYTRSDGRKQKLTLADIADRTKSFEMAYNPNDCVEIRWAAPAGSPEMKSCQRHAPAEQRAEMQRLRGWFSSRERPAN